MTRLLTAQQLAEINERNRPLHVRQGMGIKSEKESRGGAVIKPAPYKKPKYGNVWTVADGIKFQSKREAHRYQELMILQKAGKIADLTLQVKLSCDVNGIHICDYRADFKYYVPHSIEYIVEDAKGYKTREYRIKKKLVKACLGIDIIEV